MKKAQRGFENAKVLIIVAAVLLLAIGGWYAYDRSAQPTPKSDTGSSWFKYKDDKYGFSFDYPSAWGTPQVSATNLDTGQEYIINFHKKTVSSNTNFSVAISMDSDDATAKFCDPDGKCSTSGGISKSTIESRLKTPVNFAAHDSDSYSTITTMPQEKISGISVYQKVNLSKIKVSAVVLNYQISNSSPNCIANKFSSVQGCVSSSLYDTLSTTLKSFKTT